MQTMSMLAGALLGLLLGGGLAWWLGQRRLLAMRDRVVRLEQARHQAMEQTSHARRQLEHVQKEAGELRHLLARSGAPLPAPRPMPIDPALIPPQAEVAEAAGFAPTQLIQR